MSISTKLQLVNRMTSSHSKLGGKTKGPTELKNKTQTTAMQILQREESNAKRSRMECLLIQQYTAKYGSKHNPRVNAIIKSTITNFMKAYQNVEEAEIDLTKLETQLNQLSGGQVCENRTQSARNDDAKGRSELKRTLSGPSNVSLKAVTSTSTEQLDPNKWQVVNAILALSEEDKRRKEMTDAMAKKLQFREELDHQLQVHKSIRVEAEKEKLVVLERTRNDVALFEKEQEEVRRKKEEHFYRERQMRLQQIEERKLVKEQERLVRIAHEKVEMERSKMRALEEEEMKKQRKEEQKRAQDVVYEENLKHNEIKAEELRLKREYENRLNREYEAKLEREEQARQSASKSRVDEITKFAKRFEHQAVQVKQQSAANDQKVFQAILQKDKIDSEREQAKLLARQKSIECNVKFNRELVENKRLARLQTEEEGRMLRHKLEYDIAQDQVEARRKAEQKRNENMMLKLDLDKQVQYKQSHTMATSSLSAEEISLNKSLLKKLSESPELMNKVVLTVQKPMGPPKAQGFSFA